MDGFSYLLASLLDLLQDGFVGSGGLDDDLLLLERNIERGDTCVAGFEFVS